MVIIDFTLCSYFAAAVLLLMLFQAALSPFVFPLYFRIFCILHSVYSDLSCENERNASRKGVQL